MIYAATSLWLTVIVLLAWCVYYQWTSMLRAKLVNAVLLPGTLIAQMGHVVALLITGATVNNTSLMGDKDSGAPATTPDPQPKIPVLGPMLIALLPMLCLSAATYWAIMYIGRPVLAAIPPDLVAPQLPQSWAGFWDQLRSLVTLAERTLQAVRGAEMVTIKIGVFIYLMTCLSARMAPLPGNAAGHIGAIAALGIAAFLLGSVIPSLPDLLRRLWPMISLTTGWLLLLLMLSLVIRGTVVSVQRVARLA